MSTRSRLQTCSNDTNSRLSKNDVNTPNETGTANQNVVVVSENRKATNRANITTDIDFKDQLRDVLSERHPRPNTALDQSDGANVVDSEKIRFKKRPKTESSRVGAIRVSQHYASSPSTENQSHRTYLVNEVDVTTPACQQIIDDTNEDVVAHEHGLVVAYPVQEDDSKNNTNNQDRQGDNQTEPKKLYCNIRRSPFIWIVIFIGFIIIVVTILGIFLSQTNVSTPNLRPLPANSSMPINPPSNFTSRSPVPAPIIDPSLLPCGGGRINNGSCTDALYCCSAYGWCNQCN